LSKQGWVTGLVLLLIPARVGRSQTALWLEQEQDQEKD